MQKVESLQAHDLYHDHGRALWWRVITLPLITLAFIMHVMACHTPSQETREMSLSILSPILFQNSTFY